MWGNLCVACEQACISMSRNTELVAMYTVYMYGYLGVCECVLETLYVCVCVLCE